MIVTFSMSCILEPEGNKDQQKVTNYVMLGNITAQLASQLLQQLIVLEAVKRAKLEEEAKGPKKKLDGNNKKSQKP